MLQVGEVFDGYLIERFLGSGGMGSVYLARHPRLPRQVALKLLDHGVTSDPESIRRFQQEADVVARLDHPNIVVIHDRGSTDSCRWIAMQFVEGIDASRVSHHEMAVERALRIAADTATALDYAHGRGVLHRDIKPANILLSGAEPGRAERALLTDFGIARLLDSNTRLTSTGTFTATLAYASPEQLDDGVVDHRSDQYSLACTLFALLAGDSPYAAANPGQMVVAHLTKPAPLLSSLRSDVPRALDGVLARALSKDPDRRFGSCTEFMTAAVAAGSAGYRTASTVLNATPTPQDQPRPVDRVLSYGPFPPAMPRQRPRSRWALPAAIAGVALAAATGGLVVADHFKARDHTPTPVAAPISTPTPSADTAPTTTRATVAPMDRAEIDRVFASYMNGLRDQNMTEFRAATCPQLRATLLGFYLDGQHLVTSWKMLPYDLPDSSGTDNILTVQATVDYRNANATPAGQVTYSWNVDRENGTYYVCGWLNDPH